MLDESRFNLDIDPTLLKQELEAEAPLTVGAAPAAEAAPAQAAPVVVVQYRNRGVPPILLFPTTLILSLGMFAAYHVLFVSPRQRELQEQARAAALAASAASGPEIPKVEEAAAPEPGATVLSPNGQPVYSSVSSPKAVDPGPDAVKIAAKAVDAPDSPPREPDPAKEPTPPPAVATPLIDRGPSHSPFDELNVDLGNPPAAPAPAAREDAAAAVSPPGDVAAAPPPEAPKDVAEPAVERPADAVALDERPTPTPEEMQRALEDEVEARRAAREEQDRMKEQARAQVEGDAQRRVDSERSLFREELKRIVAGGAATAGQEIDELCDKYGRTYGSELKAQVLGMMSQHHGKVTRDVEVRLMRSMGVPEPGILDYLAQTIHKTMLNRRNGARDPDAVRVLAAHQLLRMPLLSNPAVGVDAPASPARRRQAPAARRAIAGPAR